MYLKVTRAGPQEWIVPNVPVLVSQVQRSDGFTISNVPKPFTKKKRLKMNETSFRIWNSSTGILSLLGASEELRP